MVTQSTEPKQAAPADGEQEPEAAPTPPAPTPPTLDMMGRPLGDDQVIPDAPSPPSPPATETPPQETGTEETPDPIATARDALAALDHDQRTQFLAEDTGVQEFVTRRVLTESGNDRVRQLRLAGARENVAAVGARIADQFADDPEKGREAISQLYVTAGADITPRVIKFMGGILVDQNPTTSPATKEQLHGRLEAMPGIDTEEGLEALMATTLQLHQEATQGARDNFEFESLQQIPEGTKLRVSLQAIVDHEVEELAKSRGLEAAPVAPSPPRSGGTPTTAATQYDLTTRLGVGAAVSAGAMSQAEGAKLLRKIEVAGV